MNKNVLIFLNPDQENSVRTFITNKLRKTSSESSNTREILIFGAKNRLTCFSLCRTVSKSTLRISTLQSLCDLQSQRDFLTAQLHEIPQLMHGNIRHGNRNHFSIFAMKILQNMNCETCLVLYNPNTTRHGIVN